VRNFFLRRSLVREAEDAEEEREFREKKGFWGSKVLRKPTLGRRKNKAKSFDDDKQIGGREGAGLEHADVEEVRVAPGGGTLQGARDRATSSATDGSMTNNRPRANTAGTYEADLPARHLREDGDYYADDVDESHGPIDIPGQPNAEQQPGGSIHLPHPHLPSGLHRKHDRPTWVKETWEDLKVGDFVRLHADESVPAGRSYRSLHVLVT
jgi:phospholipid-translocating ATPase